MAESVNRVAAAFAETVRSLDELEVPYMLIGGFALSFWGSPRGTLDADISVWVEADREQPVIEELLRRLKAIRPDPIGFVRRTNVLPVLASNSTRVDIVFARLPEERRMIERAIPMDMGGEKVRVATLEDLIYMKLLSERYQDQEDATNLLRQNRKRIDRASLEPRVREAAEQLAMPEILTLLQRELSRP